MSNTKQWNIDVNGTTYLVEFIPSKSGKHNVRVNGEPVEILYNGFNAFTGIDQKIMLGEKEVRIVIIGKKADIAMDGVFVDSKKTYYPLSKMAWWSWMFVVLCLAIPVVALGGLIPIAMGISGAILCARTSTSPYMKTPLKILMCLGITLIGWGVFGLQILIIYMMSI